MIITSIVFQIFIFYDQTSIKEQYLCKNKNKKIHDSKVKILVVQINFGSQASPADTTVV